MYILYFICISKFGFKLDIDREVLSSVFGRLIKLVGRSQRERKRNWINLRGKTILGIFLAQRPQNTYNIIIKVDNNIISVTGAFRVAYTNLRILLHRQLTSKPVELSGQYLWCVLQKTLGDGSAKRGIAAVAELV